MMQIRKMTMADYENIYALWMSCTGVGLNNLDDSKEGIEKFLNRNPDTCFVAEEDGVVQGYTYAGPFKERAAYDRSCELSIYLGRDAKGRGYGRKLYEAMEAALKDKGFLNMYACIADPITEDEYLTKNSEQFHQHLGFVKVGEFHKCACKFGRWYNMIWMEKFIGKHI